MKAKKKNKASTAQKLRCASINQKRKAGYKYAAQLANRYTYLGNLPYVELWQATLR